MRIVSGGSFCIPNGRSLAGFYETSFPAIENPLSDLGYWRTGLKNGIDWTDPQVVAAGAQCTQSGAIPPPYTDSIGVLTGPWSAAATAEATCRVTGSPGAGTFQEIELLLRFVIGSHVARGYEINFSTSHNYSQLMRWNGALNAFQQIGTDQAVQIVNGDKIKATASGTNPVTITVYVNGAQRYQLSDDGSFGGAPYTDGNPGLGLYFQTDGSGGAVTDYQVTHFKASNSFF